MIYSIREDVGRLYAGYMQTLGHIIEHLWILMFEGIAGTNKLQTEGQLYLDH